MQRLTGDGNFKGEILERLEAMGVDDFAPPALTPVERIRALKREQQRVERELRGRTKICSTSMEVSFRLPDRTSLWVQQPGSFCRQLAPQDLCRIASGTSCDEVDFWDGGSGAPGRCKAEEVSQVVDRHWQADLDLGAASGRLLPSRTHSSQLGSSLEEAYVVVP